MNPLTLTATLLTFVPQTAMSWIEPDPIKYEEQFRDADFVGIVRIEAIELSEGFERMDSYPEIRFKRITISWHVETILKGESPMPAECDLLRRASVKELIAHSENYRKFALASIASEEVRHYIAYPQEGAFYLCFLTRSESGQFLPTTGLAKSSYSFIEIKPPARAFTEPGEQNAAEQPATRLESK